MQIDTPIANLYDARLGLVCDPITTPLFLAGIMLFPFPPFFQIKTKEKQRQTFMGTTNLHEVSCLLQAKKSELMDIIEVVSGSNLMYFSSSNRISTRSKYLMYFSSSSSSSNRISTRSK